MKKQSKNILLIIILGALIFLIFEFQKQKEHANREIEINKYLQKKYQKFRDAQSQLAKSFALCASDSLNSAYLDAFITHEIMPLGLAWQLANTNIDDWKAPTTSLENTARKRLSIYILFTEQHRSRSAYNTSFHSSLIYELINSDRFKNKKPEDIEIGTKEFDWLHFSDLAKKCKATPYDLDEMSKLHHDEIPNFPASEIELKDHQKPDYQAMKIEFWSNFEKTQNFKKSLLKIKSKNLIIINNLTQENEVILNKKNLEKSIAEELIFKKP